MDLTRLGGKRTRRTRTWASVCAGLFGDGAAAERSAAGRQDDRQNDDSEADDPQ